MAVGGVYRGSSKQEIGWQYAHSVYIFIEQLREIDWFELVPSCLTVDRKKPIVKKNIYIPVELNSKWSKNVSNWQLYEGGEGRSSLFLKRISFCSCLCNPVGILLFLRLQKAINFFLFFFHLSAAPFLLMRANEPRVCDALRASVNKRSFLTVSIINSHSSPSLSRDRQFGSRYFSFSYAKFQTDGKSVFP